MNFENEAKAKDTDEQNKKEEHQENFDVRTEEVKETEEIEVAQNSNEEEEEEEKEKDQTEEVWEYTEPPSYEDGGRGLVYNCVGKHWACVEGHSYLQCKKNSRWLKENKKSSECMTINVYDDEKSCHVAQRLHIHRIVSASFCHEM